MCCHAVLLDLLLWNRQSNVGFNQHRTLWWNDSGGQEDEDVRCVALSLPVLCQFAKLTTAMYCRWERFTPWLSFCGCL